MHLGRDECMRNFQLHVYKLKLHELVFKWDEFHVMTSPRKNPLTHWGRVTHIYVGNLAIIVSDNGLSPGRRQAIIWTNVGILLIGPLGTNFSEMLIEIHTFSFKKIHLKMSSGKWRPFCLGLNMLTGSHTHNVYIVYIFLIVYAISNRFLTWKLKPKNTTKEYASDSCYVVFIVDM